jgi:ribosomal protein S19
MFARSSYKLIGATITSSPVRTITLKTLKAKNYFSLFQSSTITKKAPDVVVWEPNTLILPSLFNKKIAVHNGRFFKIFQVKQSMAFARVGTLVRTKKLGALIHISKKKKKKK